RESAEALLDIAVLGDVQVRHHLDCGTLGVVQVTEADEMGGQVAGLVQGPGLEGSHELGLVDQAVLKREQSEEQMAVGGDGGHGRARGGEAAPDPAGPRAGARARGGVALVALSHKAPWRLYPPGRFRSPRAGRAFPRRTGVWQRFATKWAIVFTDS